MVISLQPNQMLLIEPTEKYPALITTFPSMERPFQPKIPVKFENSEPNSLHPDIITQIYQEPNKAVLLYHTIGNKEYGVDVKTNRIIEIINLDTKMYEPVNEELYLNFSENEDDDVPYDEPVNEELYLNFSENKDDDVPYDDDIFDDDYYEDDDVPYDDIFDDDYYKDDDEIPNEDKYSFKY